MYVCFPAEHLADDLGDLGALYDDFLPYIASDVSDMDVSVLLCAL